MDAMIEFSHLTKIYKKRKPAVDDFSLTVDAPIFGFLGQNGAGKTTIMKMIVGLLKPTSGTIEIDGRASASLEAKRAIGYMPETPYFYERMKGIEFLAFCDELYPSGNDTVHPGSRDELPGGSNGSKNRIAHYEALLKKVGIFAARNFEISTYSKGMRQRLGFASALVNDPKYLFLDEPLDGLDPIGRREMKEAMLALKHEGRRVFLNTHILADVEEICDEVGIIHAGKLLYAGGVREFCAGKPLEERFMEVVEMHEKQNA
jgi:ABC-2 type transport system ATP-binding protein